MVRLYHFTNKDNYDSIQRDREVRPGKGHYGIGVYLTDMDPAEHERKDIAKKAYRRGGMANYNSGRLDYHIEFDIPANHVEEKRDGVYMYNHGALSLDRFGTGKSGLNSSWVDNAAAAAVVVGGAIAAWQLGSMIYENQTDGREQRQAALTRKLQALLVPPVLQGGFQTVPFDYSVCVVCKLCGKRVSPIFEGGLFYASTVNEREVLKLLWDHCGTHFFDNLLHDDKSTVLFSQEKFEMVQESTNNGVYITCKRCRTGLRIILKGLSPVNGREVQVFMLDHLRSHLFEDQCRKLQELLDRNYLSKKFQMVPNRSNNDVCVTCNRCGKQVTPILKAGLSDAPPVNETEVLTSLRGHWDAHALEDLCREVEKLLAQNHLSEKFQAVPNLSSYNVGVECKRCGKQVTQVFIRDWTTRLIDVQNERQALKSLKDHLDAHDLYDFLPFIFIGAVVVSLFGAAADNFGRSKR